MTEKSQLIKDLEQIAEDISKLAEITSNILLFINPRPADPTPDLRRDLNYLTEIKERFQNEK